MGEIKLKQQRKGLLFLISLWLILLASCRPRWEYLPLDDKVIDIPDKDIIFQLDNYTYYGGDGSDKIGFVNADGSKKEYLIREDFSALTPVWTDDGGALLFSTRGYEINALIEKDYHLRLKNIWAYQPSIIHGTSELLLNSAIDEKPVIKRVDLTTGDVLETYQMNNQVYDIGIGTNNFHNHQLLYQRWLIGENDIKHTELVILNTNTNKEDVILKHSGTLENIKRIIRPAFSPNGQWIAYTSNDGIYLIHPDGSDNHQVIQLKNAYSYWSSIVSWSPDGKSFVYHHCSLNSWQDCEHNVEDSIIYKYDIETGEEIVLVEGGVNPYWRWREESP